LASLLELLGVLGDSLPVILVVARDVNFRYLRVMIHDPRIGFDTQVNISRQDDHVCVAHWRLKWGKFQV
jgi:hypothetical protein